MADEVAGGASDNPYGYPLEDIASGKTLGILCWVWPCCIGLICSIVALVQKNNAFALFHAKQSLGAMVVCIVLNIVLFGCAFVAALIHPILALLVQVFILVVILAAIVIGIIPALQSKYKPFPIIGDKVESMMKGVQKAA